MTKWTELYNAQKDGVERSYLIAELNAMTIDQIADMVTELRAIKKSAEQAAECLVLENLKMPSFTHRRLEELSATVSKDDTDEDK